MTTLAIFDIIAGHARDVLPELGANSINRAEILMLTTASPGLRIPLVELSQPRNVGELADLLAARGVRVA